jgi:hypothetical protein
VTRRQESGGEEPEVREPYRYADRAQHAPPPVIIVSPGNAMPQQLPYPASYPYPAPAQRGQRQFRVMGYEDEGEQSIEGQAETVSWTQ